MVDFMKRLGDLGFDWVRCPENNDERHPVSYQTIQCAWAASKNPTGKILDIGSYIDYTIGMSAIGDVTMLDVREPQYPVGGLNFVVGDAKEMPFEDKSFDTVTSLCTLEHLGTKAFGDELDAGADVKMVNEVYRILKDGGRFILTTQISNLQPVFMENCQRIYSIGQLESMASKFEIECQEVFRKGGGLCGVRDLNHDSRLMWDFYLGVWRKE